VALMRIVNGIAKEAQGRGTLSGSGTEDVNSGDGVKGGGVSDGRFRDSGIHKDNFLSVWRGLAKRTAHDGLIATADHVVAKERVPFITVHKTTLTMGLEDSIPCSGQSRTLV